MNRPITTLNLPEYKINELHNKGFILVEDISESDINLTVEKCKEETALDIYENTVLSNIVTFSNRLDDILGGGVALESITEVTGKPGSGKTQLCLQLSLSVQLPDCFGGLDGNCVFIDSTLGFNPYRLCEIAEGCIKYCQEAATVHNSFEMFENLELLTVEQFLKRVQYLKIFKLTQLLATINLLNKQLISDKNIKLVIIDNITDPIKNSDLEYFERIRLLYTFLSDLQQLARVHKFAIVVTNDITIKFDENGSSYETSCLGDSFAHRINTKIKLKHVSNNLFDATTIKNVLKCKSTAKFQIVKSGIRDV